MKLRTLLIMFVLTSMLLGGCASNNKNPYLGTQAVHQPMQNNPPAIQGGGVPAGPGCGSFAGVEDGLDVDSNVVAL